jgi:ABC-type multidrug transport system fused ATPase/permease subunit
VEIVFVISYEYLQDTVRRELEGVTVISIAHRLNTIAFYDKVRVM